MRKKKKIPKEKNEISMKKKENFDEKKRQF